MTLKKHSEISTAISQLVERVSDVASHAAIIRDLKPSISQAMQSPPVRQLINSGASIEGIEQVLAVLVLKYSKMLHIGGTIGSDEPRTIAKMLIQEYPLNSLDDFNVMFLRGVTGRYGKVMGFDVSVIFGWAMMFQEEWAAEREKLMDKVVEQELAEKPDIHKPNIDVDKLLADHLESLRDTKIKGVPMLTKKEIREEGQSEPPRKKASASSQFLTTPEQARLKEMKIQWAREYTDLYTGKIKEGAPSFEQWLNL